MYDVLPGDARPESDEKGIFPRFYLRPVENKVKSKEAGRPIFEDTEYVEVIIAGDKNNKPHYKVNETHINRWPEQYKKFKEGMEQVPDGQRLEEWAVLTASRVKELRAVGIHTVEQLADLNEAGIQGLGMGGRELVDKAKKLVDGKDELAELREEVAKLKKELAAKKPTRKKRTKKASEAA